MERIVNEGDYMNRIRHLQDELRHSKEKAKELEERQRREEKNALQV